MIKSAMASGLFLLVCVSAAAGTPGAGKSETQATTRAGAGDGKQLFMSGTTPSCATCHALRDAGATGNIGPDLDALKPDAARVQKAVKQGFENMPAFGNVLNQEQIEALSRYVEQAVRGS